MLQNLFIRNKLSKNINICNRFKEYTGLYSVNPTAITQFYR